MTSEESFYNNNLVVLRKRWPEITCPPASLKTIKNEVSLEGGVIHYKNIQFSSKYDRRKELRLFTNSVDFGDRLTLYGISNGDLPEEFLLEQKLKRLDVILLNLPLFIYLLELRDHTKWLTDPRVNLYIGSDSSNIATPHFISSPDVYTADGNCWRLTNKLIEKFNEDYLKDFYRKKSPLLRQRISENTAQLLESRDIRELFQNRDADKSFVVGAGPSLDSTIGHMTRLIHKQKIGRYLIICVDVAAPSLLKKGISPDFIVTLDTKISIEHIIKEQNLAELRSSMLVHSLVANGRLLTEWPNETYRFSTESEIELCPPELKSTTCLFSGGSVIHPATDFAIKIGCSEITFFGTDFGFPSGKTHSTWENDELLGYDTSGKVYVLNGNGDKIPSTSSFSSYLTFLEYLIGTTPAIDYFNSSLIGADIRGTTINPEISKW